MKNAVFGIMSYVILTISTLITRWVFVEQFDQIFVGYGTELSGVESLFKGVISMLSLAELGIGTGLVYLLYKPIAEKDHAQIKRVLNFYKTAYRVILTIIFVIGAVMAFFIHRFATGTTRTPVYLGFTFFLFLVDTLVSYSFANERAMMIADQKNYLNNINEVIMNFLTMVLQVVLLLVMRSFVVYILVRIVCRIIAALLIHRNFKKLYPELHADRSRETLVADQRKQVFANLYALLFHKIGGVAAHKAGILVISGVLGTVINCMYSYYLTITEAVTTLVSQLFSGITASFGDYLTGSDLEAAHEKFNILYYFNFVLSSVCSTAIFLLIQPFIGLWVGEENRLSDMVALLASVYFYVYSIRRTIFVVRDVTGLHRPDRYMPLVETGLNVGLSLMGAIFTGRVEYVLLGNLISMLVVPVWIQPLVVYRHIFHRSAVGYFVRFGLYAALTLGGMAVGWWLVGLLPAMHPVLTLVLRAVISVGVSTVVCILPFVRTTEFAYLRDLAFSFIKRKH